MKHTNILKLAALVFSKSFTPTSAPTLVQHRDSVAPQLDNSQNYNRLSQKGKRKRAKWGKKK